MNEDFSRREFLKKAGRLTLLGILAGACGSLLRRSSTSHECTGYSYCKACSESRTCILPRAQSYRKTIRRDMDEQRT